MFKISSIMLILLMVACGGFSNNDQDPKKGGYPSLDSLAFRAGVSYFDSCGELQNSIKQALELKKSYDRQRRKQISDPDIKWIGGPVPANTSQDIGTPSDSSPASKTESFTNTQVQGIDEADRVKVGQDHIFTLTADRVQVVDRTSLDHLGSVAIDDLTNVSMFTAKDRLVVLGSKLADETVCEKKEGTARVCEKRTEEVTEVRVYATTKGQKPEFKHRSKALGAYTDARLLDHVVYLILQADLIVEVQAASDPLTRDEDITIQGPPERPDPKNIFLAETSVTVMPNTNLAEVEIPNEPLTYDSEAGTVWNVPCNRIGKPAIHDLDFRLTKVVATEIESEELQDELGYIGGGEHLYMTQEAIYFAKQGPSWMPSPGSTTSTGLTNAGDDNDNELASLRDQLAIIKVVLSSEQQKVELAATGLIKGRLKDQWAYMEFSNENSLVVATTTDSTGVRSNHLFALEHNDARLEVRSSIEGFGETEDIRSIRYIGATAYVVTFRQVDPLFAFDLSDLSDLRLLDELKIPGFSAYMHPANDSKLIGVGYDSTDVGQQTGVQISLFDIANNNDLQRIDHVSLGTSGSYTEVAQDHHAFFYSGTDDLIAIPVIVNEWNTDAPDSRYGNFTGAVFYHIDGRTLKEAGRASHREWWAGACEQRSFVDWGGLPTTDVSRIFKVDDRIITASSFGIKAHDPNDLGNVLAATPYGDSKQSDCQPVR